MSCKKCKCKVCSCIKNDVPKIAVNGIVQNQNENDVVNIKVPTKTSQLINDSGFGQGNGGQKIEDIRVNGELVPIINKEAIMNVPTKTSNLINDSNFATKPYVDTHIVNKANPHNVTKEQVGLENVDNTSDLNKPISTATQNALNTKISGVKVNGEYVVIEDSIAEISVPTKTSDLENNSDFVSKPYVDSHIDSKNNPHNVTKIQVGLGNVDNTSDLNKPISTATQNALDSKIPTTDVKSEIIYQDLKPVNSKAVEKYAIKRVNTITELRNTKGEYDGQIISLLGYYEVGDKEVLNYIYQSIQLVDDGGSVINNTTGSWLVISDGTLDIKDFGAKGVNTDDTQSFLNALNYFKKTLYKFQPPSVVNNFNENYKATLNISNGIYKISSELNIPRFLNIVGESRESCIIKSTNKENNLFNLIGEQDVNIDNWTYSFTRISNLTLAGIDFGTNPYAYHNDVSNLGLGSGLNLKDFIYLEIRNVRISGFEHSGIKTDNSYYILVDNIQCDTNARGILLLNSTTTFMCNNSIFSNNSLGIRIDDSFSNHFDKCLIESNNANFLEYPLKGDENDTFLRTGSGVILNNSYNNSFNSCYIEENIVNVTLNKGSKNNSFRDSLFCPSTSYNNPTYITPCFLIIYGESNNGNSFIKNTHIDTFENTNKGKNVIIHNYNNNNNVFETCNISDFESFITINHNQWFSVYEGNEMNSPMIHNSATDHKYFKLNKINNPYLNNSGVSRPIPDIIGFVFFDSTLNKPIWWNGSNWIDSQGSIA